MPQQVGLSVRGLAKSYGGNTVLAGIDLEFAPGRVHALLGANGAGKSTLLGCLSGATRPDGGAIEVGGSSTQDGFTPREAFRAGIAIIYQHFQIIGSLSVSDNVFLGQELRTATGTIDKREQEREASRIFSELGLDIDPRQIVEQLSVGQQQMVEIARSIRRQPQVLILDEPTAALGVHEVEALLTLVRRLSHQEGLAVVYVTHLLGEVLDIADEVTVLRDGHVHWTRARDAVTMDDLVHAISPAAQVSQRIGDEVDLSTRPPVLELAGFRSPYTGPVDLTVREGEIVGVYGLLGSGRTDLLEALAGVREHGGSAKIADQQFAPRSPRQAQWMGVALVASDRKAQSLFGTLTAQENLLMPHYDRLARGLRRPRAERGVFERVVAAVGLIPPVATAPADSFSGGNAQKIAVARWTLASQSVRCLLLDEPTQGVDVGARSDLYHSVRQFASENSAAAIFASSDPEEVLALADTVVVLIDGHVVHSGSAHELNEFDLARIAQPSTTQERAS
ncbi:MAG: sugar ABC transporter ATP-binding protein [Beutenbergiaceae bacterium]